MSCIQSRSTKGVYINMYSYPSGSIYVHKYIWFDGVGGGVLFLRYQKNCNRVSCKAFLFPWFSSLSSPPLSNSLLNKDVATN